MIHILFFLGDDIIVLVSLCGLIIVVCVERALCEHHTLLIIKAKENGW